jgi:FkbM family methyltransferase
LTDFNHLIAKNKYGKYCVPASSAKTSPPAKRVIAGKVYEPKTIEFIIKNCMGGDVVHAGAYFGDFLPALASAVEPGCRVWAFEPKEEHYRCAAETISLNNSTEVVLYHAGLGDEAAMSSLTTVKADGTTWGGGSRIQNVDDVSDRCTTENINIVTIDDVVPASRNVSIIHLDVEGFEQQALKGALTTIERCRPILIVETLPARNWLKTNLFNLGYKQSTESVHHNTILTCC